MAAELRITSSAPTFALVLGILSVAATLVSTILTYVQRKRRVFIYAQIEFVFILLFGLLLVSLSAITAALLPSNANCVATVWLVNIGYSFELVPLVVKIAAINKLMQAAKKMRRITLNKQHLFRAVGVLTGIVIVYMIVWTVMDPPVRERDYQLTDTLTADGSTIVTSGCYCRSTRGVWAFVSVGFQALLLLCASVLAFTTRGG